MASTFTTNTGIEKIGDGEQSGVWSQTTNLNFDIVDRALNGSAEVVLSGTTHTLTTLNGELSDGQFAVILFAGSPSGANTVTIAPSTAQKLYWVRNTTAQSVVLSQGSGGNVTVAPGTATAVYADGAGGAAAVVQLTLPPEVTLTGTQTLTNKTISFADNTLTGVAGLTASQTLTNKTISFADNTLTGVAGLTASQTLTNKTISFADNTLTGVAGLTASQTLTNKTISFADNTLTGVAGLTATQTLTNKTLTSPTVTGAVLNDGYTEEVFAVTDGTTVNLDPNNGSIQTWTLGANRTPGQANWDAGQSITLLVDDDGAAYTITWATLGVVFKTDGGFAPTLNTTGETVIELWKVGTTIYGARVGDA